MARVIRHLSHALLAAAMVVGLAAEPGFAQVTPGGALNGPAGGTSSTTAPSNSEGTPAGGTGAVGSTRVGPSGDAASTTTARRHRHRHRRHRTRYAARPAPTDTGSSAA